MRHGLGSGLIDGALIAELKPETIDKINRRLMVSMRSRDMAGSGAVPTVEGSTAEARVSSESASSLVAGKPFWKEAEMMMEGSAKASPGGNNNGKGPVASTVPMGAIAEGVTDR